MLKINNEACMAIKIFCANPYIKPSFFKRTEWYVLSFCAQQYKIHKFFFFQTTKEFNKTGGFIYICGFGKLPIWKNKKKGELIFHN